MSKILSVLSLILVSIIPMLKKATSTVGVDATKAALVAANEIGIFSCSKFKDGVQVADFTDFYVKFTSDEAFKAKVKAAYEAYKAIPAEIKDLDAGEGLELAAVQISYLDQYISVFTA